jgi:hypothetical protein
MHDEKARARLIRNAVKNWLVALNSQNSTQRRFEMTRSVCAGGLLAAAISLASLAMSTAVAHADPDPFAPSGPGIIDQILTQTPALFVDPSDEGGPATNWDGVGMYCENQFVRCR